MPTAKNEEDKRPKLGPRLSPSIFVGYKLDPGGVWRVDYLVIDFEAFQETRVVLHITDHDTKEIYVPGTADGDKELHSFPGRAGAIRPLSDDGLIAQTSHDATPDVSWVEDIMSGMDSSDPPQVVDTADPIPAAASEEEEEEEEEEDY